MNDIALPHKRPGGRSAQVQALVRTALEELVAEQGRERVTVPAVAERAGVSASSIYRRWGDLQGLLAETATHRLDPRPPTARHRRATGRPRSLGARTHRAPGQAVQHLAAESRGRAGQRGFGHRLPAQPPQGGADAGRAGTRPRRARAGAAAGDRSPDCADRVSPCVWSGPGEAGVGGAAGGRAVRAQFVLTSFASPSLSMITFSRTTVSCANLVYVAELM